MPELKDNHVGLLSTKTFWGALLAFVPQLLELSTHAISSGALPPILTALLTGIGSGLAVYGRASATKKVQGL